MWWQKFKNKLTIFLWREMLYSTQQSVPIDTEKWEGQDSQSVNSKGEVVREKLVNTVIGQNHDSKFFIKE